MRGGYPFTAPLDSPSMKKRWAKDATPRRLVLSSLFPRVWPRAEIRAVRMGQATCDVVWDGETLRVHMSDPVWTMVASDAPPDVDLAWEVDGADLAPDGGRDWALRPRCLPGRKEVLA